MFNKYFVGKGAGLSLFLLRLVVGVIFLVHGIGKFSGDSGIEGTAMFFAKVGIPLALFMAWVVAVVEIVAGIALIRGIFIKTSAVLLGIIMLVAIFYVKFSRGFSAYEIDLVLLASLIVLYANGAGICAPPCFFNKKQDQALS
jgi:putative oxidoreductase